MKTIRVKPVKGVELAGIPAAGADVPEETAQEWLRARLVTRAAPTPTPRPAAARRAVATAPKGV